MFNSKLYLALSMAGYSEAFFRMSCPGRLVRERVDPIVNPGKVAGHAHTVSGGSGWSPSMTFQDARAAKCSSCGIKEDMSNYWTPQLYVTMKDGTFKPVPVVVDPEDGAGGMTVYYLQRPGTPTEKLTAYPEGFRMLAGDTFKRSYSDDLPTKGISFACLGANKPETNGIPNYNCPGGLRAQVFFPSCWNGKDLDSADHKSHMSYPASQNYNNGPCPADFPVHMISIFYEILYDTNPFADQWNGTQHPFVFSNGDATGYGFHGDFLNGWDVQVLQKAIDTCTDGSGSVDKCGAVTQFTATESQQCRLYSSVAETVDGSLKKLPGCNPVTYGPDRASPSSCGDTTSLGQGPVNFVDLTASKQWEYAGCGTDYIGDRAFKGASTANDNMTVSNCIDFCTSKGFSYAGLEYARECFCANELNPKYAPKDGVMGSCGFKCKGDESQICGGWAAMSVYHSCKGQASCKNVVVGKSSSSSSGSSSSAGVSSRASSSSSSSSSGKTTSTSLSSRRTTSSTSTSTRRTSSSSSSSTRKSSSSSSRSSSVRRTQTPRPRRHAREIDA